MSSHAESERKPIYKKWWFWVIIIILIIGIAIVMKISNSGLMYG